MVKTKKITMRLIEGWVRLLRSTLVPQNGVFKTAVG